MPPVTAAQCVILASGPGESETLLEDRGGRTVLGWKLRELSRFGVSEVVLLTSHAPDQMKRALPAIQAALPRPINVSVFSAPVRMGTGGALLQAAARLHERFLLCDSASLFSIKLVDTNLAALLAAAGTDGDGVTGRLLLRQVPDAAQSRTVTLDHDRITAFQEPVLAGTPGIITAGAGLFHRRLVSALTPVCSLDADILPVLAAAGELRGTIGTDYRRGDGVAGGLPAPAGRPALFLDRDGVINADIGYVGSRDRFLWMPGALDTIRLATETGWHVFIVTNQSGAARGFFDEAAVTGLLDWLADEARRHGGTVDDVRYCPFHPEGTVPAYRAHSSWRKPAPGMLLDLIRAWELDPARCVMVGDQPTDLEAAAAAGIAAYQFTGGNLLSFLGPLLDPLAGTAGF